MSTTHKQSLEERQREMRERANHGTNSRYQQGCRCSKCKRAHRDDHREYYQLNGRNRMTHGTAYAYREKGCRCEECREWKSEENNRAELARSQKQAPRLRSFDLARFTRVCRYADAHCLTLRKAAQELGSFN